MKASQTWRELLGVVINDSQERQRIAEALGVNPVTLMRWSTSKSNPRLDNLRPLLEALPRYRQQFADLIAKEFPNFLNDCSGDSPQEIPSAFYARVLSTHTSSPSIMRASTICILILQQIVVHLDPRQLGLVALLAQCVPPPPGQKVRSLRITQMRGTSPWESRMEDRTKFFGAESQTGNALQSGRVIVIQSSEVKERLFPAHQTYVESSTVVFPIMRGNSTTGCLSIGSTQANYFTQERLDLIKLYADLIVIAFEHDEFYDLHTIELGIMPPVQSQQQILAGFSERVRQCMLHAAQEGRSLTRPKAELLVWHEFEEELLRLSLNSEC